MLKYPSVLSSFQMKAQKDKKRRDETPMNYLVSSAAR